MLNLFESVENLSTEEYQVVIEYMSTPMSYTSITDMSFWDQHLYGLKLTAPDEHGQRYFEFANCKLTKIPVTKKQENDYFNHSAILLDKKVYFYLHAIAEKKGNLQLIVHFPSHTHLILKQLLKTNLHSKNLHALSPEVYTHPGFIQNQKTYQVMRYIGHDLTYYLNMHRQSDFTDALIRAVLEEVAKVHRRGIIHTDIKPDNFCIEIIDGKIKAYLIDYDDCLLVIETIPSFGFWGTLPYYAPEFYEYLPSFIKTPEHLFDFGKSLQLSLFKKIPFFLAGRFHKPSPLFLSADSFTKSNHRGFLSLCSIPQLVGSKFTLNLIDSYLLAEEWRNQISQKTDIYALGVMLAYDFNISKARAASLKFSCQYFL